MPIKGIVVCPPVCSSVLFFIKLGIVVCPPVCPSVLFSYETGRLDEGLTVRMRVSARVEVSARVGVSAQGCGKKRVPNDLIQIPHRGRSLRTLCGDSDPCGKVGRYVQHFAPSNMRYCRGLHHGLRCCTLASRRSVLVSNWPIYNCEDWDNL